MAPAQVALRNSLAGDAAAEAQTRQQQSQSQNYTVKSGDFTLLVTPGLTLNWNDNINAAHTNALQDYLVTPTLGLNMNYPVTDRNLLQFNVTFGYQDYLEHNQYSSWYVQSGSALSFDIDVKDFWINLHERFSYVQNSSQQAAVANTATYGTSQNTVGFLTTWDLEDVVLSLGYDHQNYMSTSQEFNQTDHTSELIVVRGGFKFHPTLTAGVEATTAYTAYDQQGLNNSVNQGLNNNVNYSAGVYANWQPGHALNVQPRIGYTYYQFQQTSQVIKASNQGAWYFDLAATHDISEAVSYTLSAGHELTLGVYGDNIEDWYLRSTINWSIIKNWTFSTSFSYENGSQGVVNTTGPLAENFEWLVFGLGLSHPVTSRLAVSLSYNLTIRTSNYTDREYNQNLVGLTLTYALQ